MKIILIKDVKKVGQKNQIVEVAEGYGRNFLIKNGFGKAAVGGILKQVQNQDKVKNNTSKNKLERELEILGKINRKQFVIKVKASNSGSLFAAIHKKEVADVIGIEEKNIISNEDIKHLGEFDLKINLGGKKGKVTIVIEAK